jgi:hypothetical protein
MSATNGPDRALMDLVNNTLYLIYRFICLLGTVIILSGKMLFDFLYEVTGMEERRTGKKRVECESRPLNRPRRSR